MTRWSPASITAVAIAAVAALLAFGWPLFATPGASSATLTPLVFAVTLPVVLAVVVSMLTHGELDVKALALLGVLAAVGAAVRPLGAGTAGLETVFFLVILGARVFGPGFGFVLGVTTLFASALITAYVGPWLPYQMLATALVGLGAGMLPRTGRRAEIVLLCAYGALSAFAYGSLMDFSFWPFQLGGDSQLSFDPAASRWSNLHRFAVYETATALGWNAGRAVTNVVVIALLGPALLRILRRASRRASFAVSSSRS